MLVGSVRPRHRDLNRHQARTGGGHTFDGENRRRLVGAAAVAARAALEGRRILLGSSTRFPRASPLEWGLTPLDTRIVELFIARGLSPRLSTAAFGLRTFSSTHNFVVVHTRWRRCEPRPNPLGLLPIAYRSSSVYTMLHRGASHHAAACRPAAPGNRLLVVCMVSPPLHAFQPAVPATSLLPASFHVSPGARRAPLAPSSPRASLPHLVPHRRCCSSLYCTWLPYCHLLRIPSPISPSIPTPSHLPPLPSGPPPSYSQGAISGSARNQRHAALRLGER